MRHANHVRLRFRGWDNLADIDKHVFTKTVGGHFEALGADTKLHQPQRGIGDLFAEIGRNHDDALGAFAVEHPFFQAFPAHKFGDDLCRLAVLVGLILIQIKLEDLHHALLTQVGAVAGIFQRLPDDVAPGIIKLIFDDDQVAFFIERQQIETFFGVVKTGELFLDNQQLIVVVAG